MIRKFDVYSAGFLQSLSDLQNRIDKAANALNSGYRVNKPSDAPEDVVAILQLQGELSRGQQIQTNLGRLQNEVDVGENTIATAILLLENASVLAVQGLGLAQTAETRQAIALQVRSLQTQFIGLSQMTVQGRYIFSGDQSQQVQYTLDPTDTVTGVVRNFRTSDSRQVSDTLQTTFTASRTAEEIFDHRNADDSLAEDNSFAALESLYQSLLNDDKDGIAEAVAKLKLANTHLNASQAFYGATQNRISTSLSIAAKFQVQWTQQLSERRDADYVESITELASATTQQDAALSARARFPAISLFDFLK